MQKSIIFSLLLCIVIISSGCGTLQFNSPVTLKGTQENKVARTKEVILTLEAVKNQPQYNWTQEQKNMFDVRISEQKASLLNLAVQDPKAFELIDQLTTQSQTLLALKMDTYIRPTNEQGMLLENAALNLQNRVLKLKNPK